MSNTSTEHCLIIHEEPRVIDTVALEGASVTIGRSSECEIVLSHDAVSRRHARLERRDDDWYLVDCGSVNGVRVNGRRVQEARLEPGDVVEIRPFMLYYA